MRGNEGHWSVWLLLALVLAAISYAILWFVTSEAAVTW